MPSVSSASPSPFASTPDTDEENEENFDNETLVSQLEKSQSPTRFLFTISPCPSTNMFRQELKADALTWEAQAIYASKNGSKEWELASLIGLGDSVVQRVFAGDVRKAQQKFVSKALGRRRDLVKSLRTNQSLKLFNVDCSISNTKIAKDDPHRHRLLGWNPNTSKYYPLLAPFLFPELDPIRFKQFPFRSPFLVNILSAMLFGASTVLNMSTIPNVGEVDSDFLSAKARSKSTATGRMLELSSVPPTTIATAAMLGVFVLSLDKSFSTDHLGTESGIDYSKFFADYHRLILSALEVDRQTADPSKGPMHQTIAWIDRLVLCEAKGRNTTPAEVIDLTMRSNHDVVTDFLTSYQSGEALVPPFSSLATTQVASAVSEESQDEMLTSHVARRSRLRVEPEATSSNTEAGLDLPEPLHPVPAAKPSASRRSRPAVTPSLQLVAGTSALVAPRASRVARSSRKDTDSISVHPEPGNSSSSGSQRAETDGRQLRARGTKGKR